MFYFGVIMDTGFKWVIVLMRKKVVMIVLFTERFSRLKDIAQYVK